MHLTRSDRTTLLWFCVITVLLLIPLPEGALAQRWPSLLRDLENLGHPVAFAGLAYFIFRSLRMRAAPSSPSPWLWTLAGVAAYGALSELVQHIVGRDAALRDFFGDLLGAGFALLLVRANAARARGGCHPVLLSLAVLCLLMAALPLLTTLAAYANRSASGPVLWTADELAALQFSRWQHGRSPGLILHEVLPDWRPWDHLQIDIGNPLSETLPVVVRLNDRYHDYRGQDRYARVFQLPPESRTTLRIPLEHIRTNTVERQMQLGAMRGLMILGSTPAQDAPFVVHEIRLASRDAVDILDGASIRP